MAFRAIDLEASRGYTVAKGNAAAIRQQMFRMADHMATNDIDFDFIRTVFETVERSRKQLDNLKSIPGIGQYAQDQEDDPTYDVVAEFTALLAAEQAVLNWLTNNMPTTVSLKPPNTWQVDQTIVADVYTPAQSNTLKLLMEAVGNSVI